MFNFDQYGDFRIPMGDRELKPLTLAQMVTMRKAICQDLADLVAGALSGDELTKAVSGSAAHVAEMSSVTQAETIIRSPLLLAQAAAFMLNEKWAPMQAAGKIEREHIPAIRKAIYHSYGVTFSEEAPTEPNPPQAATDSTN